MVGVPFGNARIKECLERLVGGSMHWRRVGCTGGSMFYNAPWGRASFATVFLKRGRDGLPLGVIMLLNIANEF